MNAIIPTLTFYTKDDCHLCDVAMEIVLKVNKTLEFNIEKVDITATEELMNEFGEKIPMIYVNGKPAFKYKVDEVSLIEKIKREFQVNQW